MKFPIIFLKKRQDELTFQTVSEEWLTIKEKSWCLEHFKIVRSQIHNYLSQDLGPMPISKIGPQDVLQIIRNIESKNFHHTAHRILGLVNQIFNFAIASGYFFHNPARDLFGTLVPQKIIHHRALVKPKDIGLLMLRIRLAQRRSIVRYALLFCAYTFCRSGEIRKAQWKEINFKTKEWKIPSSRMKMRKEHTVPLSKQCLELLHFIKEMHLSDKYIFPNLDGTSFMNSNILITFLKSLGYSSDEMTVHGFRAMASTVLNEMGFESDLIEKALAHTNQGTVRAIYNRAQWLRQRRKMMQIYADTLDAYTTKVEKRLLKKHKKLLF